MSDTVRYERRGNIAVITVDNPPVNALSASVREGLADSLAKATADPEVKAMVLIGAGRTYIAGADIREFGKPMTGPGLQTIINGFEDLGEAGRGRDPRHGAGRRARSRARLPLSRRGSRPRSWDCPK